MVLNIYCVLDLFTKYALVKPLRDKKKVKTVLSDFIEVINKSKRKRNKLWTDQGRKLYNNLMQKWLDNNDTLIYSTHNEDKSVVASRFTRTLRCL